TTYLPPVPLSPPSNCSHAAQQLPPLSHRSLAPLERPRPLISTHVYIPCGEPCEWEEWWKERQEREKEGEREREKERERGGERGEREGGREREKEEEEEEFLFSPF